MESTAVDISRIPDTNAQDALSFCRALKKALSESGHTDDSNAPQACELSIVIPILNEHTNIPILYDRLNKSLINLGISFELIFVDDGSKDDSAELLRNLAQSDPKLTLIELSRNFGHQVALTAGLEHTTGKAVITMDADLQDPPEIIPEFYRYWKEGYDVVYGLRVKRKEPLLKRIAYAAFYRILRHMANIQIPMDAGDFCIMDRKVVDILNSMTERNRFIRGIRSWIGLKQKGIPINRPARETGRSKYSWDMLVQLALDGLISFSIRPLRMISYFGIFVALGSIVLGIAYAVQRIAFGLNPPGLATIIVLLSFFSGVQLITIGMIGEYLGRVFDEVKKRPLYVLKRISRQST